MEIRAATITWRPDGENGNGRAIARDAGSNGGDEAATVCMRMWNEREQ